jgi:hypothetical protein
MIPAVRRLLYIISRITNVFFRSINQKIEEPKYLETISFNQLSAYSALNRFLLAARASSGDNSPILWYP